MSKLVLKQVTVLAYNGGFTGGLGSKVGQTSKAAGSEVVKTTNSKERITKTVIHSDGNNTEAAELVASYFVEPTIGTDSRADGTADVMVGLDFAGLTESGLAEIMMGSGTICLAPSPPPSALSS